MIHKISTMQSIERLTNGIFEDFNMAKWLTEECEKLLSEDTKYSPFVALGLISRIGINTIPQCERRSLRKMAKSHLPDQRIANWWKNHRDHVWSDLEGTTIEKSTKLLTMIFDIREIDTQSLPEKTTLWLRRRDHLESVLKLIGKKDASRIIADRVAEVDRLARKIETRFTYAEPNPLLATVAKHNPTAWWGKMVARSASKFEM